MPGDRVLARSLELDPAALSAASARQFVGKLLREARRAEWVDAAELAVSEVVTNAVLHAHTRVELTTRIENDHVRVEVRDHNPSLPSPRTYGAQATTGRGMALVEALSSAWGVQSLGPAGKVVWFCIGGAAPSSSEEDLLAHWEEPRVPVVEQDAVPVLLRAFPTTLWFAARQHHDAALRELALLTVAHPGLGVSESDLAAADEARFLVSDAVEAVVRDTELSSDLEPGARPAPAPPAIDLEVLVRPAQAGAFGRLQDVLDEAQRLALAEELLLPPALPEIIAARDWMCEQVIGQIAGATAAPWPGTDDERFVADRSDVANAGDWDAASVSGSDRLLVAADQANRILAVSSPLADVLGWTPEQLVGRRVVTIVPARYREAHVAGFMRHLSTGETRILGVPVEVPALRADGTELPCRLLITADRTPAGWPVFVAEITPLGSPGHRRNATSNFRAT